MHSYSEKAAPMSGMTLQEAAKLWLQTQRERRRPKTIEGNLGHLKRLLEFFGDIPLSEFTIEHFEQYQRTRSKTVSPSTINHELNTLSRILRRADLWTPIKNKYSSLPDKTWKPPKIFDGPEQELIFKKLKGNPELELAEIVFKITLHTTASGCELRGMKLRDVELNVDPPRIHIPPDSTKNNVRPRTIPLNNQAVVAFERALARASKLGCKYPEHHLFPFRVNRALYNPQKPASSSWLRKQTAYLRELTGIKHINPHTFRHLAVTELFERGAPEETVIALAGWVGRKMVQTYSHARMEAKADAVNLLTKSAEEARRPRGTPSEPKPPTAEQQEAAFISGFYVSSGTRG